MNKYEALGAILAQARRDAGFENQKDLALLLNMKQQSISRWEAGSSRPRADQLPVIADALNLDLAFLMERAGYTAATAPRSLDYPFPFDQLLPETFERLAMFVVDRMYEGKARVLRAGVSGHTQDGLDVTATLDDGAVHTFQCKRQKQFGPAEAQKAIEAHTAKSDKKHLVLSRVVSPQTARVMEAAGWDVWDKEKLSHVIRSNLSVDDQMRLVDIYFPGKRFELLGQPEPGPWQTIEQFFAPFEVQTRTFSHTLALQGRTKEIELLLSALDQPDTPVVLLSGAGGIGKSRVLKEALKEFSKTHPAKVVRLLSVEREAKAESLDQLTRGPKLLVVDDAHDRDGLAALVQFAAIPSNQARLLLATRPYAEARLRRDAAAVGVEIPDAIKIERLPRADSVELARSVLRQYQVSPEFAEAIVDHVGDNPLVTVMAARVIAAQRVPLEAAKNAKSIRDTVLGKFKQVIIGDLGLPGDEKTIKGILDVLALVQPFHIEDPALFSLIEKLKGIDKDEATRILRLFHDGGIIYRRGPQYRLMPDLLGDYIIEESCIAPNEKLSPFAERAFEAAEAKQLENLLVNLGRMDWRRQEGDPADSRLLDSVWQKLRAVKEEYDPRLNAIAAVAIYQPRAALEFVEYQIREGNRLPELSKILRGIAFNIEYTEQVCEALWELGKDDSTEDRTGSQHPMKVLENLCGFGEHKPLAFSERVFKFAMSLSLDDRQWKFHHAPLEIMIPVLSTEGVSTTSTARAVSFSPTLTNYEMVESLRKQLIDHMLDLLEHHDIRIARKAAISMDKALRGPMGMMSQAVPRTTRDFYDAEFGRTIDAINERLQAGRLQPIVLLSLCRNLAWLAQRGAPNPQRAARAFLKALPTTLEFRLLVTLTFGGGGDLLGREYEDGWREKNDAWLKDIAKELKDQYSNRELLDVIEDALQKLDYSGVKQPAAHVLINYLMADNQPLARDFIASARAQSSSLLLIYLPSAIYELLANAPKEGRAIAKELLEGADETLAFGAAAGFRGIPRPYDNDDLAILKIALSSPKPSIVSAAMGSFWNMRVEDNPRRLLDLARAIHFENAPRLADELFMLIWGKEIKKALTREDVRHFLTRLRMIPEIDEHHIQEFLAYASKAFPFEAIDFFLERVDHATKLGSFEFRPVNHGPYSNVSLRFQESQQAPAVLAHVWQWLHKHEDEKEKDYVFFEHASSLFEAIFPESAGTDLAQFFGQKLDAASALELKFMARLLRTAPHEFVFTQPDFVIRFLERCRALDAQTLKTAISTLISSAISGVRSGTFGEPFPRDIQQRDESKRILKTLPRLSPAFDLYDSLLRIAEREIDRQKREAEALDDRDA